jgi:hypothetical protein
VESGKSTILLAGAVIVAGAVAALRTERHAPPPEADDERAQEQPSTGLALDDPQGEDLPPGHPPIGETSSPVGPESNEPPAITWSVPAKWKKVPNPSSMRIATYHVPPVAGAADEASVAVARAGGSVEANLERWSDQFADAGSDKRSQTVVRGFRISLIEVSGTFQGGGMGSDDPKPRRGWSLRGAVVEADQDSYFFKMTGPSASVRAARSDFDSLINSIAHAQETSPER